MSSENVGRGLVGLRLLSLESRRAEQMAKLIESHGGIAVVAPSMREIPLEDNSAALSFAEELFAGKFDVVIFLTGVGTRILFAAVETKYPRETLVAALSRVAVVARGPKPVAALREFGVPIAVMVPEPNTWREIIRALDQHQPPLLLVGKRIAVQEYGIFKRELIQSMEARDTSVTSVPVYQWALPEDTEPLRRAIREIIDGKIDVLLVTSANQVHNMMEIAAQSGLEKAVRQGLQQTLVVSVGPISTEAARKEDNMSSQDIGPNSTMGDILNAYPSAKVALFQRYHIGGCASCGYQPEDTLAGVLQTHNIADSLDTVVDYIQHSQDVEARLHIHPKEVAEALDRGEKLQFFDVRSAEEWEARHIPDAPHLTVELKFEILDSWPKDAPIIFLFQSGAAQS